ncbi:patatin-like phospholipase domain-containing protein 4 [Leptonychotes weddellii]|uniref:Patatin-like phospholipase domain-containing protein 4 n=1 Tax=Leptonychotes weddellii TaxID=9713 RepID=A0A2U3XFT5_LEPWE|nr:patatin-like phospholipase domain-containing protein 4 [Leptonychotes weddellii]
MASKDVHTLISSNCGYVTSHGKKDFVDIIEVKILKWGDDPRLSGWIQTKPYSESYVCSDVTQFHGLNVSSPRTNSYSEFRTPDGIGSGGGPLGDEEVMKVLLASSFVPIYAGLKPVEYKGQKWVDGGLTNSLPILPVGRTVTISPFSGRLDISPRDRGQLDLYVTVANQDIMLSVANLVRLSQALFPPSKRKMESLYQHGFDDTIQFLLKENWFE